MENIDLYGILELNNNCTKSDIRKSYKKLILKYHPDKHGLNKNAINIPSSENDSMFIKIKYAYEVLYDDNKRYEYDMYKLYTQDYKGHIKIRGYEKLIKLINLIKDKNIVEIINFIKSIKNSDYDKFFNAIITKDYNYILNTLFNNNSIDITHKQECSLEEIYYNYEINIIIKRNTKNDFITTILPKSIMFKGEGEGNGDLYINIIINKKTYYGITYNVLYNDLYTSFPKSYINNNILTFTFIDKNEYRFDINTLHSDNSDIGTLYYINNMGLLEENDNCKRGKMMFILIS
jgi:DnaJ-class molecular chaperone